MQAFASHQVSNEIPTLLGHRRLEPDYHWILGPKANTQLGNISFERLTFNVFLTNQPVQISFLLFFLHIYNVFFYVDDSSMAQ